MKTVPVFIVAEVVKAHPFFTVKGSSALRKNHSDRVGETGSKIKRTHHSAHFIMCVKGPNGFMLYRGTKLHVFGVSPLKSVVSYI